MKAFSVAAGASVNELINIAIDRLIDEETKHDIPAIQSIFEGSDVPQNHSTEYQLSVEGVIKSQKK